MSPLARWLAFAAALQSLVSGHALVTIACVIFAEEIGIPFLFPGDLMMVIAGIQVREAHAPLWAVLAIEEAATLSGAATLFWISRSLGLPVIARFGQYVGIRSDQLERATARMHRHEFSMVLLGRLVPGFRVLVVIAAGVSRVDLWRFFGGLTVGSFLYVLMYTLLGMWVGQPVLAFVARLALPASSLWSLGALATLALSVRALRRSPAAREALAAWPQMFLLAGLIAGTAGLLAGNIVLGLASVILPPPFFDSPLASGGWRLAFGWPSFLVTALLLSWAYGLLLKRGTPWFARAVAIAIPIVATILTIDPIGNFIDLDVPVGVVLSSSVVNGARWLTFIAVFELMPYAQRRPIRFGR